jgi:hypothetical protein
MQVVYPKPQNQQLKLHIHVMETTHSHYGGGCHLNLMVDADKIPQLSD